MGEPINEVPAVNTDQGSAQDSGQEQDAFNPAWKPLLDKLPTQFHGIIAPELKTWDTNYQQGLQKVHSQYEPYKPFIDQSIEPATLNEAMLVYQAMQDNPGDFVKAVSEFYQLEQGQAAPQQQELTGEEEPLPFDITKLPEWQQQQQLVQTLAQAMLQQNEQAQTTQAEAQLADEFAQAQEKYKAQGGFDEGWVAQHMYLQGSDIDTAVAAYKQFEQGIIARHQRPGANAPVMMGSGGGLPSQQTPVSDMSDQQRKQYIAQRLAQFAQQSQGG
jgi:hypothetical protein